jgi:hypothetical protein
VNPLIHANDAKKSPYSSEEYGDMFPLYRKESYFIPDCNEIFESTALGDDSGSDSIGDYGIRPWKRYNL